MDQSERRRHLEELVRESEEAGLYDLPPILGSENLTSETVEALGRYCRQGWYVFPCKPGGKEPVGSVCPRGWKDATSDWPKSVDMFIRAAHQTGGSPNIGIACEPSGLVVLDIDPRNGGSFAICEEFWRSKGLDPEDLKECPTVATGGQGWHLYFRYEGQAPPQATIAQGIERKSRGVYVIAPPSIHPSGLPYKWVLQCPPEPLPQAVALAPSLSSGSKNDTLGGMPVIVPEGQRNDHAFRLLSAARAKGVGREGLLALVRAVNAKQYKPPLPDDELVRIVDSVLRYPPGQAVPAQAVPAQVRQVVLPPLRSLREFDEKPSPPPKWVVERLFLENQIGLICGPPYAGKSLFAMDVGISIASQAKVVGNPKLQVPRSRGVAYIYAEQGDQQWERNAFAVARHKGVKADIPFHLVSGYEMDLTKRLERLEFIKLLRDRSVEVCIFDPLAVLFRCEDENDASKVILAARRPLQHFVQEGIVPVVVHHATKDAARYEPDTADKLVRGSNDIIAMTGSIIGVWDGKDKGVKVTAQGRGPMVYPFKLRREPTESYPLKQDSGGWLLVDEQIMSEQVPVLVYDGEWETEDKEQQHNPLDDLPEEFKSKDAEEVWGISRVATIDKLNRLAKKGLVRPLREGRRSEWKWVKCSPAPSADAEEEDEG